MSSKLRAFSLLCLIGLLAPLRTTAQVPDANPIVVPPMASVFRVSTPSGEGSGFLTHESGLVVTNAHVTAGEEAVEVQLDDYYKVEGWVAFEDPLTDIAVVQVHPDAVLGLTPVPLSLEAFDELEIGDPILAAGFPMSVGRTLTRGILGRKTPRTLVTDAAVNPGNSGGPLFDRYGRAVGVASFAVAETAGPGLGGGISATQVLSNLEGAASTIPTDMLPLPDSLPVMPTDAFPIDELRAVEDLDEWPLERYDISNRSNEISRRYDARVFTPLVQHFLAQEGGRTETADGGEVVFAQDLRYWSLDLGAYSPVVIVRITPKIGQSGAALWGNILLGALTTATDSYAPPLNDPEFRGSVDRVLVQFGREFVRPIQTRLTWSVMNGQAARTAYVVLDPMAFCSDEGRNGRWSVFTVDADSYMAPFPIGESTHAQVCSDFEGYLAESR